MAMRTDCKNYESRSYANGEVVRKCRVDLAPEAPWRCPADCIGYERRMFDAGWQVGSLSEGYGRPEPEPEAQDVAALLDAAEDIVNSAAPEILSEFQKPKRRFGKREEAEVESYTMAELDEFRVRVREFLATHADRVGAASGGAHDDGDAVVARGKAFQNALADAGLAALTYPVEAGGAGLDAEHQRVFDEESADYEMPSRQFMVGIGICAPTLLEHGTDEQRRTYLPGLLRADAIWCQLFSEPGAGSDVASLQTRAERDGEEWVVNGQKVWTSGAHYADYGLLVARTNRDVPKHRGISMFIVDMHSPGVTSLPLRQIDGRAHFNEVFLDDVRLPADAVVGHVDDGWRVTLAMLANERVAIGAGGSSQSLSSDGYGSVLRLARARGCTDDLEVRQGLAELYVLERILALLGMRIREALVSGRAPGPEGSVAKLAATVLGKQAASLGMAIAGAGSLAWSEGERGGGHEASAFLFAPMLGIAGGTTEIQKNIIGERVLGLPKDPAVDKDVPFKDLLVGTQK